MKQHKAIVQILACALAVPAASHAAVKYWDNPDYRAFDVDCYVSGAFWNYDGIRNAGATAAHDSSATTWKNLGTGGATYDLTEVQTTVNGVGNGQWNDTDGYVFAGGSRFRCTKSMTISGSWTAQMLVDAKPSEQRNKSQSYVMSLMWNYFAFGIGNYAGADNAFFALVQGANGSATPVKACFVPQTDSLDYATTILDGDAKTVAMFDGTAAPAAAPGLQTIPAYTASRSDTGYGVGGRTGGDYSLVGTVKFFRYYPKVLSNEEIAWNRVVDERRFFDRAAPLPVTNAVVVSSIAANEPDGCYAVDENGYTFTAPRTATVGGDKYLCTGYTLETWDAAAGDWGAPVFHARELSCAVTDASRVRIAWQWTSAEGLATYDVSDYVWDGLELFYDGICNVGTNAAHSATATTWKNLGSKGAVNDMFLQRLDAAGNGWIAASGFSVVDGRDPGAWTADGFALKGDSRFRVVSTAGTNGGIDTSDGDYSLQTLLDANAADQNESSQFVFSLSADAYSMVLYKSGRLDWRSDSATTTLGALSMAGTSFDYVTAIANGTDGTLSLFSGTEFPSDGNGFKQLESVKGHKENGYDLGGYGNANYDKLLVGTIKFFRQYDHALAPAEVAQNRRVDDFRYFGKFAETDVLVQSSYPLLRGNEPDGEYDVDGSHAFTAPATATVKVNGKEIVYACAGYTVETWDGSAWSNARRESGNAFVYSASSGKTRLTWLWKGVSGLRTAADYGFDDCSQAGLVWNYDGICNAGVGVHDPNATTWKNLGSGANADLHWNGATSTGAWADDGYAFAGGPRFKGDAAFRLKNFTMQTLLDADAASQTAGSGDHAFAFNGSQNYFAFRIVKSSYDGSAANSLCWVAQGGTYMYFHAPDNRYGFATAIQDFDNKKAMMFPDTTIPAEYVKDGTHGAQRLYNEFSSMSAVSDTGYGMGNINTGAAGFVGTVKNFRYYDRVLTQEEIERNRNADAARWFGVLGVTNVVVAVEDGSGIVAAEAVDTPYFVEGAHTFTAAGGPGTGCRISVPDGLGGWRPHAPFSEMSSFTYDKDDAATPPCVKIIWLVRKPFVLVVR